MTENTERKAYIVSYPGFEFPVEIQIVWAERPSAAKYIVLGSDGAEDVPWTDLRVKRAKELDDHEDDFNNDSRFKNLWYLNHDCYTDNWQLLDGTEVRMWDGYYGAVNGDTIREALDLPFNYDIPLTYEDVDRYANNVLKEQEENASAKS